MDSYKEAVRYILATHIMFSTLSTEDKKAIEPLFEARKFEESELVSEQSSPIDGMYFVYSGKLKVKQTIEGRRVLVGEFGQDTTLGEMSLIKDSEWEYQLTSTSSKTVLLVLPSDQVRGMLPSRPAMEKNFKRYIGQVVVSQRLRAMLGSGECSQEKFKELLSHLGVKRIPKGKNIFSQGDDDPRLYFLETGTVDLIKKVRDDLVILDRVSRGEVVGEIGALAEDGKQTYTAQAVTDTTVLVIKKPAVDALLSINPLLGDQFKERRDYLVSVEQAELESLDRAEGIDMRIRLSEGVTEDEFRAMEDKQEVRTFPIIKQGNDSECGAACLTMITKHYGKNFKLGQIKELSNTSSANDSPLGIITGAENLGFQSKAYALKFEELKTVKLPGIVGWEGSQYSVLYKVSGKKVFLADPVDGKSKTLTKEEFITGWTRASLSGKDSSEDTGLFIGLNPTTRFNQLTPPKKPLHHFINFLLPYKHFFMEAMGAALIINLLGLASPLFIQVIVDTVVVHKDVSLLNMMLGGMVLVAMMTTLTRVVQSLLLAHTTARVDMRMMSEFYRHILSLPMPFFLTRNKGEILARFGENAKIRAILTGSTITVILNTLMLTIYFLMMFSYNSKLTFVVLAFIPGYIGLILYFTPRIKAISQQIFLTNSQSQSYLIESLNGIESIKATANEYMARSRWEDAFVENVNNSFKQAKLILTSTSLHSLLGLGSTVFILWIGANQVIAGTMSIGELMGFNMLVGLVMAPIQQMVQLWNNLQDIRISIDRVSDVLNVKPEQEMITDVEKMPKIMDECDGSIDFKDVNFSYMAGENEQLVMRGFNLNIGSGEHVAFVGASGCGKSTIAKMILGFNIPKSGECTIDGVSILDYDFKSLRQNIGVVLQDPFLISGSVAENIALGDPEPDMRAVKRAAMLSGVDGEIMKWPLGYQTRIGEKGMGISGGQRQRVCIARALYRQPKILIFDEATSALDNESESLIQENMRFILKGRTSITIAHRLSTIIDADKICFIADGKVSEMGTHKQLIDANYLRKMGYQGKYYKLAQTQFGLPDLDLDGNNEKKADASEAPVADSASGNAESPA
ncbi:peptidase domain-containing ABC transporter [Maridesulfovibrio sp.]|uniref:peptidase domain-containing ABC transporter n=1 Tax=Maridesulfovibrio sp. TaxID=2795000 RepID=UPI0029CA0FD5|nr:peptidase domain-containing ABC transporter [Maridesulfovibrio sp.]